MLRRSTLLIVTLAPLFPALAQNAPAQRIAEGYSYEAPRAEKLDDAAAHAKLLNWVENAARAREQHVYFRNTSDQPLDITSYEFYECLNVSGVKCGVEFEGPRLEPGETIVLEKVRHRNMDQRMSYRYRFSVQFAAAPPPPTPRAPGQAAGTSAPPTPESGWPSARIDYLDRVVPILMRNHAVPGAAIVLVNGPQIQWSAGYGVAAPEGPPVTPETVFQVGSLGEPVIALTLQRLADVRSWFLEAPISTWAHEESYPADFASLTAAELLSHTGGVEYDAVADRFSRAGPAGEWRDSGGAGYTLLRHLVEMAEGHDFVVLARALVWEPHSLGSMRFDPPAGEGVARGHDRTGAPLHDPRGSNANVAVSLYSSAVDYARFLIAVSPMSRLEPVVWRRMTDPRVSAEKDANLSWGLGWAVTKAADGSPLVFHRSSHPGFKSFVMVDERRGLALVILTNGDNGLELAGDVIPLLDPREHAFLDSALLHSGD